MTSSYVHAPTKYLNVGDVRFAYREVGPKGGIPIVMLHHFTAVIDEWDPAVVDGLATEKHVVVFDNRGIGSTGGVTPSTVKEMAADAAAFIRALGHDRVDVLGFSLGGYVAQQLTMDNKQLVNKLILAGTGPSGIFNSEFGTSASERTAALRAKAVAMDKHAKHLLFFQETDDGQEAANQFLARLSLRTVDRVKPVTEASVNAHVAAIKAWGGIDPAGLKEIEQKTFIANGDDDVMVPSQRSFELKKLIRNSTLSIYPGAGHGGIFQHHSIFVPQALNFLKGN